MAEKIGAIFMFLFQVVIIILYGLFVTYDREADPVALKKSSSSLSQYYPMFQDVHVMVFIGFGLLMMFLKKYSFSSSGFNFLLAAAMLEWGILCEGIFEKGYIKVGILSLLRADILAAAVLISMGAVLGKTTPFQLLIMGIVEGVVYACNEELLLKVLQVADVGGSILVHVFGAYFGLGVSMVLGKPKNKTREGSDYNSDRFAMIGTLFLWAFWPSFVGSLSTGDAQQRAVINTYIAIAASCILSFAISSLTHKGNKFNMVHIQNASLAGGVAIGSAADFVLQPYVAVIVGSLAGTVSTMGYAYFQPWFERKLGLHDTCGVHNLHGIPGILGAIVSAAAASVADQTTYGYSLYLLFPARAPENFTPEMREIQQNLIEVLPGSDRSALLQGGYQMLGLVIAIVISLVAGALTGLMLKVLSPWIGQVKEEDYFNDEQHWELELEEEEKKPTRSNKVDQESCVNNTFQIM